MEPRRGRFLAKDPPHANSDNIRGIFGTLPLAAMLEELPHRHVDRGHCAEASTATMATQAIHRLANAMALLEDMYGYVTNADLQGHARTSMLADLGGVILEAKKAADATIALFHDTLTQLPHPPPSPPRSLPPMHMTDDIPSPPTTSPSVRGDVAYDDDDAPVVKTESPSRRKIDTASDLPDVKPPITKKVPSPKHRQLKAPSPPKAAALLKRDLTAKDVQLLKDLHAEFHAKKAEFKKLRRRLGDAERHTKTRIQDHTQVLRGLERLHHDLPL